MAAVAVPRLGTPPAECNRCFALSVRVSAADGCALCRYLVDGQALTVCVDGGLAVAFLVGFRRDCWPFGEAGPRPADPQPREDEPLRLLVGDNGWALATPACPHRLFRAAAALA
jgi:hypothetical protein